MGKLIACFLLIFAQFAFSKVTSTDLPPVFDKCTSKTLPSIVEAQRKSLAAMKLTDEQLRYLYQDTSELGVRLTLLNPESFKDKVMMSNLAFKCWINLKEITEGKSASRRLSQELWLSCAKELYNGKLPSTAKKILACLN